MFPSNWQVNSAYHITVLGLSCQVLQQYAAFYRERREEASDPSASSLPACPILTMCATACVESVGLTGGGSRDSWFMVSSLPLISMHNLGHVTANSRLWVGVEMFGMSWSEGSQLSTYSSTPALRYAWAPCCTASLNSKVLKGAGGWLRPHCKRWHFNTWCDAPPAQVRAGSQAEHPQELGCLVYTCFN